MLAINCFIKSKIAEYILYSNKSTLTANKKAQSQEGRVENFHVAVPMPVITAVC